MHLRLFDCPRKSIAKFNVYFAEVKLKVVSSNMRDLPVVLNFSNCLQIDFAIVLPKKRSSCSANRFKRNLAKYDICCR